MDNQGSKLNIDEIIQRLRINDKDIIDTIYSIYYDLLEREEKHRSELDNKAYSLSRYKKTGPLLIFGK